MRELNEEMVSTFRVCVLKRGKRSATSYACSAAMLGSLSSHRGICCFFHIFFVIRLFSTFGKGRYQYYMLGSSRESEFNSENVWRNVTNVK